MPILPFDPSNSGGMAPMREAPGTGGGGGGPCPGPGNGGGGGGGGGAGTGCTITYIGGVPFPSDPWYDAVAIDAAGNIVCLDLVHVTPTITTE